MNRSLLLQGSPGKFVIRYSEDSLLGRKPQPVSVSSERISPKPRRRRQRLSSDQASQGLNTPRPQPIALSVPTISDDKAPEREYSRVPIQYFEERDIGSPAQRVRGRIVYRGYAPKNTYYFFKTVKEAQMKIGEGDYRGEQLIFNSKFESGNLAAAVRVASREYWLFMREDSNTHGLRQWFFFEVRSRKAATCRFRIYRFSKRHSLYRHGMRPFVRTPESSWTQSPHIATYDYDANQKCYYLEFEYNFEEHRPVQFATLPPYTYSALQQWLQSLSHQRSVVIRKLGLSLGGLDIFSFAISSQYRKDSEEGRSHSKQAQGSKEAIIVLARTHPGQTASNWALQAFVDTVLQTPALTEAFSFFVVPMVNPDGVFLGNHRTGVLGQDLNRRFTAGDLQFFPQIEAVETFIAGIARRHRVAFLLDLHGHSAKRGIFAFGEESEVGSQKYLSSRILPKILADSLDSFLLESCLFRACKEKSNTARVFFSQKYGLNAITFEQSYGLLPNGGPIGIANWRNFGHALAESLLIYARIPDRRSTQGLRSYLEPVILADNHAALQKRERQREKEREKEKQREREREKQLLSAVKTEGAEDSQPRFMGEIMRKLKYKTPREEMPLETERELEEVKQERDSSLSSGERNFS